MKRDALKAYEQEMREISEQLRACRITFGTVEWFTEYLPGFRRAETTGPYEADLFIVWWRLLWPPSRAAIKRALEICAPAGFRFSIRWALL